MRAVAVAALAACALVAFAGCGDLFDAKAPEGYACSSTNGCPPGQQCVMGEHVCRTPCTQTAISGMTGPMQTNQCNINSNMDGNRQNSNGWACDYDHFCRPQCGASNGTCAGCSGTDVCDTMINICRPSCVGGCPSTWGCVGLGGSGIGVTCAGCRPLATSTFLPPKFADPVFYDGDDTSDAVAVGNLAGPGPASVVAVHNRGNKITVYASDATGALAPPVAYGTGLPSPRWALVLDLTRDGKADVVVATVTSPMGGPVLLPGNGDGTLGAPITGPHGPGVRLAAGDFDGDGKPEVVGCGGYNQLSVTGSDGMGGMKTLATVSSGAAQFQRLGAADFNGDGKVDLWADDMSGFVQTFLGNGSATALAFAPGPQQSFATRIDDLAADIDGDGKPDLVVLQAMPGNGGFAYSIVVAHNTGMTGFTTSNQISVPAGGFMTSADFDGDGHPDVALVETAQSNGTSNVDILSSDGKTLVFAETVAIGKGSPQSIAAGDVDGDGKPDLVLGTVSGVVVLLNQTASRSASSP